MGDWTMKNYISIKVTDNFKDFVENVRATRQSKVIGTDKEMLNQTETIELIVKYFSLNNDRFVELIKMEFKKNV
jgi:hypothetical protein